MLLAGALGLCVSVCGTPGESSSDAQSNSDAPSNSSGLLHAGEETYLAEPRQLTFEGQNAEAYFAPGDERLVFQATSDSLGCDQIFTMSVDGSEKHMVSTGGGVTTCGYFLYPAGDSLLFSSTHLAGPEGPPRPDYSRGYVWPIHAAYDVFVASTDGSGLRRLTDRPGYDAEATMSRDGSRIVFTSVRDGDHEIYTMQKDGSDVRRLTHEPGYDGGAFFSYDGSMIVYRAHHPDTPAELEDYRGLLGENLVRPSRMEIWVMDDDGSNQRQLTDNGAANFAPYFFPDGERIVFASNLHALHVCLIISINAALSGWWLVPDELQLLPGILEPAYQRRAIPTPTKKSGAPSVRPAPARASSWSSGWTRKVKPPFTTAASSPEGSVGKIVNAST